MSDFYDQYRCPFGKEGKIIANRMNRNHRSMTVWTLKNVQIKKDDNILDVGCGGGRTLGLLSKKAMEGLVIGIDLSLDMVKYSREINKSLAISGKVEVVHSSVENLSLKNAQFNLVTGFEAYFFWPDFEQAIKEIFRVVKPGGWLVIGNEMMKDGSYELEHADMIKKTGVKLLSLEEMEQVLRRSGFVDVEIFLKKEFAWNSIKARKPFST